MLGCVALTRARWYRRAVPRARSSIATALPPGAAALAGLGAALVVACAPRAPEPREPMGKLPGLVTTATPQWLPHAVFAGDPLPADPRERRLGEPRSIDVGGDARRVAWSTDGGGLLVEALAPGARCEAVVAIDLEVGAPRRLTGDGVRARLGGALPGGRVLLAESPCDGAGGAWSLVAADPDSGARVVVTRLQGEPTGVATDGASAFVALRDARGRGRVDRVLLDEGRARPVLEPTAAGAWPAFAHATLALVVARDAPGGGTQLVVASDEGGDVRAWSRGSSRDGDPTVTPDGRAIVFASGRAAGASSDGVAQLYVGAASHGEAEGGPAPERLTFAGEDNRAPAVAPGGRHLAWISDRAAPGGPRRVVLARFDGEP